MLTPVWPKLSWFSFLNEIIVVGDWLLSCEVAAHVTLKEAMLLCPTWSVSALGPSFSLWINLSINMSCCMQSVQFMSSGEPMISWVPKTGSTPNLALLS